MQITDFQGELSIDWEFLIGDINWRAFGGKWISPKMHNGDWNYWLVIELINLYDAMGDKAEHEFIATLSAVSPEAAGEDNIATALACCGMWDEDDPSSAAVVEALHSYGISALLWHDKGDNPDDLLLDAKIQAEGASSLFGFYMDAPKNALGHTGWDFIKGDLSIDTALENRKGWGM